MFLPCFTISTPFPPILTSATCNHQTTPTPPPLPFPPNHTPTILSPMAGVTNAPYRTICASHGAALYISEMLHASHLTTSPLKSHFSLTESPRSAQLLGHDPATLAAATRHLITAQSVQHIDLNFGCPVRKVVRKGAGSSIPTNIPLLRSIVRAVVAAATPYNVPVTAKMRLGPGLHPADETFLAAGAAVQQEGGAGVILHARSVSQGYSGSARENWHCIGELVRHLDIPVIGNGDVFTAAAALDMVRETGCAGVAVGRGCLGRPWLFADLQRAFRTGVPENTVPGFEEVRDVLLHHVALQIAWCARAGVAEAKGLRSMRRFFGWYLTGYLGMPDGTVAALCAAESAVEIAGILAAVDERYVVGCEEIVVAPKGKT